MSPVPGSPAPASPAPVAVVEAPRQARLRIRALGAATVHSGDRLLRPEDWTYGKPRELLYLLAGSAPRTKEQIGVALWPGLPAGELRSAFHTALHQLRQALGGRGWVVYADGHYAFDRSRDYWYDVEAFEAELLAARQAASPPAALPHLERALAVYTGDFLADMNAGEWVESRRAELRRAVESALLGAGRLLVAEKRYREAVDVYLRAVAQDPLLEVAHRELMRCWARVGEPARAIRHYLDLTQLLRDELGVRPAAETTAVFSQLTNR